jgi:hypothetical protein
MSKARTINDYYATVFLRRYHKDNPSKTGERTEIVVRIPEEAAKAARDVLKIALGKYQPAKSEPILVGGARLLKPTLRLLTLYRLRIDEIGGNELHAMARSSPGQR